MAAESCRGPRSFASARTAFTSAGADPVPGLAPCVVALSSRRRSEERDGERSFLSASQRPRTCPWRCILDCESSGPGANTQPPSVSRARRIAMTESASSPRPSPPQRRRGRLAQESKPRFRDVEQARHGRTSFTRFGKGLGLSWCRPGVSQFAPGQGCSRPFLELRQIKILPRDGADFRRHAADDFGARFHARLRQCDRAGLPESEQTKTRRSNLAGRQGQ